MPNEQIIQNVADSKAAAAFFALFHEEPSLPIQHPHFWEVLACLCRAEADKLVMLAKASEPFSLADLEPRSPAPTGPMSEEEAVRFSQQPMEFSQDYLGVPVKEVPGGWIVAITSDSPFKKQLRRYAQSAYFQRVHMEGDE